MGRMVLSKRSESKGRSVPRDLPGVRATYRSVRVTYRAVRAIYRSVRTTYRASRAT